MNSPAYALVVFNLPLQESFTYEIPPQFTGQVKVGMRVLVPFGKRRITGYVVALSDTFNKKFTLKPIADLPDSAPVISEELLSLTRWMADYYHAGWGEAIKAALPGGLDEESHEVFSLTEKGKVDSPDQPANTRRLLFALRGKKKQTKKQLRKTLQKNFSAHTLAQLQQEGYVQSEIKLRKSSVAYTQEKRVRLVSPPPAKDAVATLLSRSPRQKEVFEILLKGECPVPELAQRVPNYSAALRQLIQKGLAETVTLRQSRQAIASSSPLQANPEAPFQFTPDQETLHRRLCESLEGNTGQTFLLHGITGSGKTEIYIRCIQRALQLGKTAIMMVPEISLTPQTVHLFQKRFGEEVAILHSGLSNTERFLEWDKIRAGKVSIVIGARSAVFAPFSNLGVIIIDEEHDTSYKQDSSPRYHARDTAIVRARLQKALVILGSATPSLESRWHAETGKYHYLSLNQRIGERFLPLVRLVDMRKEREEFKNFSILSTTLKRAVLERLERKEQVFLFLNRRGTANYVLCRACGFVFDCPRCSVSLTFHGQTRLMMCHYCNYTAVMPKGCVDCGGDVIRFSGFGTQKLEAEARKLFPSARIMRMDRDTTRDRSTYETVFREMNAGKIDILIGTQMITKGHDFHNVTLVGVVHADQSLHIPDFRSSERSFQLLTQVAGRAGRGKVPGLVILQTNNMDHYVYNFVRTHDYQRFYQQELSVRKRLHFPPFTRLAALAIEGEDEQQTEAAAQKVRQLLGPVIEQSSGVELLGPARAALYRLNEKFRWHIILRAPETKTLQAALKQSSQLWEGLKSSSGKIKITLDVDPVNML